jgi:hypothetical protein
MYSAAEGVQGGSNNPHDVFLVHDTTLAKCSDHLFCTTVPSEHDMIGLGMAWEIADMAPVAVIGQKSHEKKNDKHISRLKLDCLYCFFVLFVL